LNKRNSLAETTPCQFAYPLSQFSRTLSRGGVDGLVYADTGRALLFAAVGIAWYGWNWQEVGRFMETTDDAYVGGNVTTSER
jgi:hypothetical protein